MEFQSLSSQVCCEEESKLEYKQLLQKYGTKGTGPAQPGRPRSRKLATAHKQASRYTLPIRQKNQVKQKIPFTICKY